MHQRLSCPLGHKCQTYDETGIIDQCRWFTKLVGKHPQTGEDVDEEDCAMAWLPIVSLEIAKTNRGQTQAIEMFRNNMHRHGEQFLELAKNAGNKHLENT